MGPIVRRWLGTLCFFAAIAPAAPAASMPQGEYLDGKDSRAAVILAHGRGGGADSNVVGPLRRAIHRELGFHTLSLDLPLPEEGKPIDPATFPQAYERIRAGVTFLKEDRKVERIYLLGYSMGARTTSGFLASEPASGIVGYIGVGIWGGGEEPFNANLNLRKVRVPVLDVYGGSDPDDTRFAERRKALVSDQYRQESVGGAMHTQKGHDADVARLVNGWLKDQEAKAGATR